VYAGEARTKACRLLYRSPHRSDQRHWLPHIVQRPARAGYYGPADAQDFLPGAASQDTRHPLLNCALRMEGTIYLWVEAVDQME
jgi:hypothetical protein